MPISKEPDVDCKKEKKNPYKVNLSENSSDKTGPRLLWLEMNQYFFFLD